MNHREWTRRLADINEAIYDANKELGTVKTERAYFEALLNKARERGEDDPSILSSLEERFEFYDNAYSKLKNDLELYKQHLQEHYNEEPPKE